MLYLAGGLFALVGQHVQALERGAWDFVVALDRACACGQGVCDSAQFVGSILQSCISYVNGMVNPRPGHFFVFVLKVLETLWIESLLGSTFSSSSLAEDRVFGVQWMTLETWLAMG